MWKGKEDIQEAKNEMGGLSRSPRKTLNPIKNLQQKAHQGLGKLRKEGVGSHSANREWEVGKKTNYDDVDDGRSFKR